MLYLGILLAGVDALNCRAFINSNPKGVSHLSLSSTSVALITFSQLQRGLCMPLNSIVRYETKLSSYTHKSGWSEVFLASHKLISLHERLISLHENRILDQLGHWSNPVYLSVIQSSSQFQSSLSLHTSINPYNCSVSERRWVNDGTWATLVSTEESVRFPLYINSGFWVCFYRAWVEC